MRAELELTVAAVTALFLLGAASAGRGDGTLIVVNKSESTVSLVGLKTGEVVATLPTGPNPHEAAVSPDGKTAIVTNYGTRESAGSTLTVIDAPSRRVAKTIDVGRGRRPHGVVLLDSRRALVTAEGTKALLVVDVGKGVVEAAIETRQEVSHMVAATPDGGRAFVTNIGSGTVTAIDIAARKVLAQVPTGEGAEGVAVTPDGKEVWVTNRAADTVSILDARTLKVVGTVPSASFPIRVAITPDGRRALVSNARSGDVSVFDVATRKEVARRRATLEARSGEGRVLPFAGSAPIGILVHPGGERAYVAHANADAIAIFDLGRLEFAGTLPAGREPDGMAFSPLDIESK
jgi:YVTN family beta-propeller protein